MARQGNYVTIPGVDPNWAKGISSALSDLSNTYNKRAADERAEAERLAAAEESKRRYELDRQDLLAQRERQADQWQKTFDQTAAQNEAANTRADAQLAIAQANADYLKKQRQQEADTRDAWTAVSDLDTSGRFRGGYKVEDHRPEVADFLNAKYSAIGTGEKTALNYLNNPSQDSLQAAKDAFAATLKDSDLSKAEQINKVNLFGKGLEQQRNLISQGSFQGPLTAEGAAQQFVSSLYTPGRENLEAEVASGRLMLHDSQVRAAYNRLDPKTKASIRFNEFKDAYGSNFTNLSRSELDTKETARITAAQTAADEKWKKAVDVMRYMTDKGRTTLGVGSVNNAGDMTKALKAAGLDTGLSADDIGSLDSAQAQTFIKENIGKYNPEAIANIAMLGVSSDFFGSDFPEKGSAEYARMTNELQKLDAQYKKGGNPFFTEADIKKMMNAGGTTRQSLLQQQLGQSRMRGDDLTTRLPEIPAAPAPRIPQRGVTPDTRRIDDVIKSTSLEDLVNTKITPVEERKPVTTPAEKKALESIPGKELLASGTAELLDLGGEPGMPGRSITSYTPKQKTSRKILDTVEEVKDLDAKLAKWGYKVGDPIPDNAPRILTRNLEDREELLMRLKGLEARLRK